ncbi:Serine protease easter [Orchesella cincta]|uniref:CLIP domain-containing serine protease n=1 Tax=Orchesella cincta TaxID=48709 RepID=A0A1D2MDB9_ORCCI|nr:Serine protease easter [Orchesella cincta]
MASELVQTKPVLIILLAIFAPCLIQAAKYKRCESLDENYNPTVGQCIEFPLCPRFLELAKNRSKTVEDFQLLRRLTCGFINDKPRVCCPDSEIYHPPVADEDDLTKLAFLFPDDSSNTHSDYGIRRPETGDASYSKDELSGLIPKLEDCGEPRVDAATSTRIFGGNKADVGEFPYMALLYRIDTITDEEEFYCSATIVNQFYLLTAAHCIFTNQNSSHTLAFVQVGITDVNERCQKNNQRECIHDRRYEVKETIVHPKYVYGSRDRSHDIALIRTTKAMDFNSRYIRPVCLPFTRIYKISPSGFLHSKGERRFTPTVGTGIVAGWGRESNSGSLKGSSSLKKAVLPVLSRGECQHRYAGQVKISDKQICAGGERGTDTCVGDSGGPLLMPFSPENEGQQQFAGKMFQTGIISFGPALCGTTGKPTVYTKLVSYVDWILENMHL